MAVEQPLGLTLEIMRQRSFARTWQDAHRQRREGEPMPSGPMMTWVDRIQARLDEPAIADVRALMGR